MTWCDADGAEWLARSLPERRFLSGGCFQTRASTTFGTAENPSEKLQLFQQDNCRNDGSNRKSLARVSWLRTNVRRAGKAAPFRGRRPNRRIDLPDSSTRPQSMSRGQALTSQGLPIGHAKGTCLFSLSGCRLFPGQTIDCVLLECPDPQRNEAIGLRTQGALARNEE
jgi:hypothetical protein